jgi:hypothetical protein
MLLSSILYEAASLPICSLEQWRNFKIIHGRANLIENTQKVSCGAEVYSSI